MTKKTVYTIPAGVPFAKALAAKLLQDTDGKPELLSQYRILLPTRRACSILKEAFLELSHGKPLLLPRLQPLGDIDEEELSLSMAADQALALNIPPVLPPMKRQMLLARAIMKLPEFTRGFDQALSLASTLGQLMDHIYTEGLKLENLSGLVPSEFSAHWQITIDFLKILSEYWPQILAKQGAIDPADRRNRLIRGLSDFWKSNPPDYPVIAAGSTGSIPATANLLNTVAALPKGSVVLPGLDQDMDEESWNNIGESHPQYGLRHLLQQMETDRDSVKLWPHQGNSISQHRRFIAHELMRPAATTGQWADLRTNATAQQNFKDGLHNLHVIDCPHEREEAELIAVLLRDTLEEKDKTAALITPDRNLARRVAMACGRWGINIDDSAGQTLNQTLHGVFLRLCLQAAINDFAPVSLLALLKHSFSACSMDYGTFHRHVQLLERSTLRGPRPAPGLQGILGKLEAENKESRAENEQFLRTIAPTLEGFTSASQSNKTFKFNDLLKAHLRMAEAVATSITESGKDILWKNEAGEAASTLFAELMDYADLLPRVTLSDYSNILDVFMKAVTVRPSYGTHPRLKILGQLEARMTDADLVILGGLNEGTWPADPAHDPWMSRPMRSEFGLPGAERSIGLAAHDFVQGFCAPETVITRSARSGGTPTVPSRWLQRFDTVLQAAKMPRPEHHAAANLAALLDAAGDPAPFRRPEPKPPLDKRPRTMSATRIEEWMRDPYSTYARYVLRLKKLDPLEKTPDAAERGKLLHNILREFAAECPSELPDDAIDLLHDIARSELEKLHEDPVVWSFWWPRFSRLAEWLVQHEQDWRQQFLPALTETRGATIIDSEKPFTLEATPDRIDNSSEGAAVIDYKSGGKFTKKGIGNGQKPQLALEALILKRGGFEKLGALNTASLSYWLLTGGITPGEITKQNDNINDIIETTENGLKALIAAFDNVDTVYYSLPRPANAPDYNNYEHLARVLEWSTLSDDSQSESGAA